jgi:hypothetical protein
MKQEFTLGDKKHKFFLWFHCILSGFYLMGSIIMFWYSDSFSDFSRQPSTSTYQSIIFNGQAKIFRNEGISALIQLIVNVILVLIIRSRIKYTKEILNLYVIVMVLLCSISLIKGLIPDIRTENFDFSRLISIFFIFLFSFSFYYLNGNKFKKEKKELDNIDIIGTHND